MSYPFTANFYGPVNGNWWNRQLVGPAWTWLGAASAGTKRLCFNVGPMARVLYATWVVVWAPTNPSQKARLVWNDEAGHIEEICQLPPQNITGGPLVTGANFTAQCQAKRDLLQFTAIGHQFQDDGLTPWMLYESRLELVFE